MSLLRRLGGLVLQRPLGQLAACQAASIHCSSIAEARKAAGKKKEDSSDSESDAEGETPSLAAQRAAAAAQEEQEEWPPALDHSQLRNLGALQRRCRRRRRLRAPVPLLLIACRLAGC